MRYTPSHQSVIFVGCWQLTAWCHTGRYGCTQSDGHNGCCDTELREGKRQSKLTARATASAEQEQWRTVATKAQHGEKSSSQQFADLSGPAHGLTEPIHLVDQPGAVRLKCSACKAARRTVEYCRIQMQHTQADWTAQDRYQTNPRKYKQLAQSSLQPQVAPLEFIVERVMKHRVAGNPGKKQYLVKWEGYPTAEATWEPASSLQDHVGSHLVSCKALADYERPANTKAGASLQTHTRRSAVKQEIPSNPTCPICMEAPVNEVVTQCRHVFCKE